MFISMSSDQEWILNVNIIKIRKYYEDPNESWNYDDWRVASLLEGLELFLAVWSVHRLVRWVLVLVVGMVHKMLQEATLALIMAAPATGSNIYYPVWCDCARYWHGRMLMLNWYLLWRRFCRLLLWSLFLSGYLVICFLLWGLANIAVYLDLTSLVKWLNGWFISLCC